MSNQVAVDKQVLESAARGLMFLIEEIDRQIQVGIDYGRLDDAAVSRSYEWIQTHDELLLALREAK